MARSKVQRLYDACQATFSKGKVPRIQGIQWLGNLLDNMQAADVGIDEFSESTSPFSCGRSSASGSVESPREMICTNGISQITYVHIYECDFFSIGVFCFPAGGELPLHDHPKMTVLSKVLYGSVQVKAYDWEKRWHSGGKMGGLGRTALNGVRQAPCAASVLFPACGGNIHSFLALTPCAILDVLSPPYSDELGRPSTYYRDIPLPSFPGYAILKETQLPDDLAVINAPYLGPQLSVDEHVY